MQFTYCYFVTVATVSTLLHVRTEWIQIPFLSVSQMPSTALKYDEMDLLNSQVVTDKNRQIQTLSVLKNKHLESSSPSTLGEEQPKESELKSERVNMFSKNINEETLFCTSRAYNESNYKNKGKYKLVIDEEIKENLKNVHEEIFQEAEKHPDLKNKLELLDDLKNKLMGHAELISKRIWIQRNARGHKFLGFPSMEGALMTIAFLTFAVFLIKIVKQFIQGLQTTSTTMVMQIPTTAATQRLVIRHKRDLDFTTAQIIQYMENFRVSQTQFQTDD